MTSEETYLGRIYQVVGAKLFAEISDDLPSASPIIRGRVFRIGQVGSFVRIPLGLVNLYGIVSTIGSRPNSKTEISESLHSDNPTLLAKRWLEIQLIGESVGGDKFERGISIFPTIDDEIHLVTEEDLKIIYGEIGESSVKIGTHAASQSLGAYIDLDKLVSRHGVIVGSTGSGKSNTVAGLVKSLSDNSFPNAQIIIIDLHSEYSSALKDHAEIFSVDDEHNPLAIPYWVLNYSELAWILFDKKHAMDGPADTVLRDWIAKHKVKYATANNKAIDPVTISSDSPIPFKLTELWYDNYVREYATLLEKDNWDKVAFKQDEGKELRGDAKSFVPPEFKPPAASTNPPFRGNGSISGIAAYLTKIPPKTRDRRLSFLFDEEQNDHNALKKTLSSWLHNKHQITILDLGGIPSEITDIIIGVISRIIFEIMFWGRDIDHLGRQRPVLIFFEEAHLYLPRGGANDLVSGFSSRIVRRVFKEGRKYGLGAMVVSQRPSDLDETILSQCGTYFALRLSNSEDQGRIKSALSDNMIGFIELLPALRTGEAIVVGEAVKIPSRIRLPLIEPRPKSSDPEIAKNWRKTERHSPNFEEAIENWIRQKIVRAQPVSNNKEK